jgi:hypothetical protein
LEGTAVTIPLRAVKTAKRDSNNMIRKILKSRLNAVLTYFSGK